MFSVMKSKEYLSFKLKILPLSWRVEPHLEMEVLEVSGSGLETMVLLRQPHFPLMTAHSESC